MFWRTVKFYSQSPEHVLNWPLRLFWSSVRHLDRIRAESDLRVVRLLVNCQAPFHDSEHGNQSLSDFQTSLTDTMGEVIKFAGPILDIDKTDPDEIRALLGKINSLKEGSRVS